MNIVVSDTKYIKALEAENEELKGQLSQKKSKTSEYTNAARHASYGMSVKVSIIHISKSSGELYTCAFHPSVEWLLVIFTNISLP